MDVYRWLGPMRSASEFKYAEGRKRGRGGRVQGAGVAWKAVDTTHRLLVVDEV
jgi:hypothetical protein